MRTREVYGASPEQVELVRWAVERFEAAGLQVPPLEVSFHPGRSGCQGFPALSAGGRIHMCPGTILNLMPRRNVLHEMGHVWITANLDEAERDAFLELRGATTWSSWDAAWEDRGFEQAAEVIAWALGDRILGPRVEIDPEEMATAYRLLTGSPLPAWDLDDHLEALDANPVICSSRGCIAMDALVISRSESKAAIRAARRRRRDRSRANRPR